VPAEESKSCQQEVVDIGIAVLMALHDEDQAENEPAHRDTVKLLFTVIQNLIANPLDPQKRRFNKTNKTMLAKVLAFPHAVRFLELVRIFST
jgi:hypothetical protein